MIFYINKKYNNDHNKMCNVDTHIFIWCFVAVIL